MTSFMDSIYAGKDRFVQDQERKRQETTRRLFGDALQNKPDALTQLYGVDPATALKAKEQNQGDRVKGAQFMHRAATVLKSAPDDQKPIVYSRLIQEAKNNPNVAEFTQGLPDQYDPSIMQHVDGLIGMAGMYEDQPSSQNGIQSTFINDRGERVGILRNGQTQVLGMNAPNNQIVEGDGGYFGVNKTTLGAAPVQLGGPSAPMAPPRAPAGAGIATDAGMGVQPTAQDVQSNPGVTWDNGEFNSLSPIEKAKFNSYVSRKVPFQIVGGKVVAGQSGGTQLRPAPKDAPKADVPSGYRLKADGASLEPIPGGPADKPKAAPAQTAAAAKASKANAVMKAQLPALQRRIERLQQASDAINGMFDGGPLDQYALKLSPANSELESAAAQLKPVLMSFVRVPGIGAQSDLEARLDSLQYPDASQPPAVRNKNIQELKLFIKDLTDAMNGADAAPTAPKKPVDADQALLDKYLK